MKTTRRSQARFAVCIQNKGYEASLEIGKLYRVIPDQGAEGHGYLRIVDERSEERRVGKECRSRWSPYH